VERLFYSILVGILMGFGAALWLPPKRMECLLEMIDVVQARAQSLAAPEGGGQSAPGEREIYVPAGPSLTRQPINWPGSRAGAPPIRDGQANDDVEQAGFDGPPLPGGGAATASDEGYPAADYSPDRSTVSGQASGYGPPTGPGFGGGTDARFGTIAPRADEGIDRTVQINRFEGAQIIARYGGEVILANEFLPEIDRALAPFVGKASDSELEEQRMLLLQRNLQAVLPTKLVVLDAKRKIPPENWKKIQQDLSESFDKVQVPVLMDRYQVKSRAELMAELERFGSSIELQKRAWAEKSMASQWAHMQAKSNEEVTHEEIVAYYREHLTDYDLEAKVRWEQLSVRFDRFPDKAAAFRELARMGNLVIDGAPFGEVARRHSHGFTARDGGVNDWTTQGSLVSEVLDQALFTLPVGVLSSILEDAQGFHIVRVIERRDAGRTPFEEAQVEIKRKIRANRRDAAIESYVARVTEQTKTWTIFDDPDAAQAELSGRPPANPPR
jgi:hypothetical protein